MRDYAADNALNPPILETHAKPMHDARKDNLFMFVVFSAEALISSPMHTFWFAPTGTAVAHDRRLRDRKLEQT